MGLNTEAWSVDYRPDAMGYYKAYSKYCGCYKTGRLITSPDGKHTCMVWSDSICVGCSIPPQNPNPVPYRPPPVEKQPIDWEAKGAYSLDRSGELNMID